MKNLLVATLSSMLVLQGAQALIVTEDFSYSTGNLAGKNGGTGFSGAWAGSTNPQVGIGAVGFPADSPNLTYSAPGYSIVQSGNGQVYGSVGAGVSTRTLESSVSGSAGGTVLWFSILANNNNASGREGLYFNVDGTDRSTGDAGFLIAGDLRTLSGGTLTGSGYNPPGGHVNFLIVGSITLLEGSTNSQIQLWINPTTLVNPLTNTSTAAFYTSFNANFGGSITNIGIEDYNNGSLDALRISDGNGNATTAFYNVVVPEPATGALILGALGMMLVLGRKSSHFRSAS